MKTLDDDLKKEKEIKKKLKDLDDKKKMLQEKEFQENLEKLQKTKAILNDAILDDKKKDKTIEMKTIQIPKERIQHEENKVEPVKRKFKVELIAPIIMIIASIGNLIYQGLFNQDINLIYNLGYGLLFLLVSILFLCAVIKYNKAYNYAIALLVILLIGLPILKNFNLIKLPTVASVPKLVGMDYADATKWCVDNKVTCTTTYDYSDFYPEYAVSYQSVEEGTRLSNVKKIDLVISNGPDLSKDVTIPDFTGLKIDDVANTIKDLYLSNVDLEFEYSDTISKDIVISQSTKGNMKRSDLLTIHVSYGPEGSLTDTTMIDLTGKTLFDATLFLKRNGLVPKIEYEYSDTIKKGCVTKQSSASGTTVSPNTEVAITISSGKKITLPDFTKMSVNDIITYTANNHLKVKFVEVYDVNTEKGKVIKADHNEGDAVGAGTLITITVSLGKLTFPAFNSVDEFRSWASTNNIKTTEEYQFNKDIEKGKIIKFNLNTGDIVNTNDTITIYISNGNGTTVPNFYGMTKAQAQTTCNNNGFNCSFVNANSYKTAGTVIYQNKTAGAEVPSGTYITLSISTGTVNSGGSSSGGGSTTPTTPTCDRSNKITFYVQASDSFDTSCNTTKNINKSFTINCVKVENCSSYGSASTTPGDICNTSSVDGIALTPCDTVTLYIVQ